MHLTIAGRRRAYLCTAPRLKQNPHSTFRLPRLPQRTPQQRLLEPGRRPINIQLTVVRGGRCNASAIAIAAIRRRRSDFAPLLVEIAIGQQNGFGEQRHKLVQAHC